MRKSDFHFDLPVELIAQRPIERREKSRLMCLDKRTGGTMHRFFYELPELLCAGDCLVLNDTRVLPARLFGRAQHTPAHPGTKAADHLESTETTECTETAKLPEPQESPEPPDRAAGAPVEVVLLRDMGDNTWECLTRPGKKTREGAVLAFGAGELSARVFDITDGGNRLVKFDYDGIFLEILERLGKMPLPPYIHEELKDAERYQTVYSRAIGSAAAPTAGLHFTNELLDDIKSRGVRVCYVTLHVGLGTFRPVRADNIEEHMMHEEYYIMPDVTAAAINQTKSDGGRVIAVGTTSCRTMESCADGSGKVTASSGFTDIFIYPGYVFKCTDALITNFHLPESTLIMLVSALAGRDNVLNAYKEAIRERYRFFSFGDAMLVV